MAEAVKVPFVRDYVASQQKGPAILYPTVQAGNIDVSDIAHLSPDKLRETLVERSARLASSAGVERRSHRDGSAGARREHLGRARGGFIPDHGAAPFRRTRDRHPHQTRGLRGRLPRAAGRPRGSPP